jgi:hypothetical protein
MVSANIPGNSSLGIRAVPPELDWRTVRCVSVKQLLSSTVPLTDSDMVIWVEPLRGPSCRRGSNPGGSPLNRLLRLTGSGFKLSLLSSFMGFGDPGESTISTTGVASTAGGLFG